MTTSLSPSKIGKLQEMFGAALRKADGLFDAEAQEMIEKGWNELKTELETACVAAINRIRERKHNTIVRTVSNIRRARTAQQAIKATGRKHYINQVVVDGMPVGEGPEEVKLIYFHLGHSISAVDLAKEYEIRGLIPDPQAQAADNEADPAFADDHPNCVQWKDVNGNFCYAAFGRWGGGRGVDVGRVGDDWYGVWWFAGRRK